MILFNIVLHFLFGSRTAFAQKVTVDYTDRIVIERKIKIYSLTFCHLRSCNGIGPNKTYSRDELQKMVDLVRRERSDGDHDYGSNVEQLLFNPIQTPKGELFIMGKIPSENVVVTGDQTVPSLRSFLEAGGKSSSAKAFISNNELYGNYSSNTLDPLKEINDCRDYLDQLARRALGKKPTRGE